MVLTTAARSTSTKEPAAPGAPKPLRNLREIAPTIYFNVPKGYRSALPFCRPTGSCARNFFSQLKAFFYAGAGLRQTVWDALKRLAIETCGERILMLSSLGSTEKSPLALAAISRHRREPGDSAARARRRSEARPRTAANSKRALQGPSVTPGYWRAGPAHARGLRRGRLLQVGDALRFVDPADPGTGLLVRRPDRRGLQALHRHMGQRRPLEGEIHRLFCALVSDVVLPATDRDDIAPPWSFPIRGVPRARWIGPTRRASTPLKSSRARCVRKFARLLTKVLPQRPGASAASHARS